MSILELKGVSLSLGGLKVVDSHDLQVNEGEILSEIGWMVLPEFQGLGLDKLAVRTVLEMAREEARGDWCTRFRR